MAYTESMAWATSQRVRKTKLDGVIQYLFSSPDYDSPADMPPNELRKFSDDYYQLKEIGHHHVPHGVVKPNVGVLKQIMSDVKAEPSRTVYVGDSLMKDITMARDAGVHDVLAGYGHAQDGSAYDLLRRVTHWPKQDVENEKTVLKTSAIQATHRLDRFDELLTLFQFTAHSQQTHGG